MSATAPSLRAAFEQDVLPVVVERTSRAFHYLRCPNKREDLKQEALLHAWSGYLDLAKQGREVQPASIAYFAIRRAKAGHNLAGSGRHGRRCYAEPFDFKAQRRHDFRVVSIGDGANLSWQSSLTNNAHTPVAEQAAFRVDFSEWLGRRAARERQVIDALSIGEVPYHIAQSLRMSTAWITHRRLVWRQSWTRFHGE